MIIFTLDLGVSFSFSIVNKIFLVANFFETNIEERYATSAPPKMSLIKWAPTITLVEAIIIAIVIRIFLIFGNSIIIQKMNANIVAVWPDGNECHFESKLIILKDFCSKPLNKTGLGLPIICFKICVTMPLNKIFKKINKHISLIVLAIWFLFFIIFNSAYIKIVGKKKYRESPKWVKVPKSDFVW